MKKLIIVVLAITALAFTLTATFMESLKITREEAEDGIWNSFSYGAYGGPMSQAWHNLAVPMRVSMVKEIGSFAKAYSKSENFKSHYAEYRENQKPSPPEPFKGVDVLRKEQQDALTKSIKESKETAKTVTGDVKKAVEEAIRQMEAQLKEVNNPNNPMYSKEVNDMMKQGWDQQNQEYQKGVKAWEEQYPISPNLLIKKRLNYFLELSASVDFSAKVAKGANGKMIFMNPDYEEKSSDWKLLYRCGKESVDAARGVAKEWLVELK